MNGAESISHGNCKFCGKECLVEYEGKEFEYCPKCRTEKLRMEQELAASKAENERLKNELESR